jgi:protein fat-free
MDKEEVLGKQIQNLDNEMQTLVYENYNKFINATQTIRKVCYHV